MVVMIEDMPTRARDIYAKYVNDQGEISWPEK